MTTTYRAFLPSLPATTNERCLCCGNLQHTGQCPDVAPMTQPSQYAEWHEHRSYEEEDALQQDTRLQWGFPRFW